MMTEEDYKVREARRMSIRAFFPILGLILMGVFAVIAYFAAPALTGVIENLVGGIPNEQYDLFNWISRAVIFFGLSLLTAMLYAIAMPKKKNQVSERGLDAERKARLKAEQDRKKQLKSVRAKMAQERTKDAKKK
ncbi:MAG: hypothetical protein H7Y11_03135 [Armatimonadetes bacterium]|nr:hypothetical protein [Anaerolineae bacterium]